MRWPWSTESKKERRFKEQLLPHATALYHFALRLSHDPTEAEDLVQDTLLRAFDALDRVPEGSHYKGWLFTILRNGFISRLRRDRRLELTDDMSDRPCGRPDVHTRIEAGHGARQGDRFDDIVLSALATLPEVQRTAVLLCDVEDMAYEDIAKVLGCPIGTVRSRIFHGRRALRQALGDYAVANGAVRESTRSEARSADERPPSSMREGHGTERPALMSKG